jgi:tetratricopeptide (TPR) repeat protein
MKKVKVMQASNGATGKESSTPTQPNRRIHTQYWWLLFGTWQIAVVCMIAAFIIDEFVAKWGNMLIFVTLASVAATGVISFLCHKRLVKLKPQFGQLQRWQPWQLLFRLQPNLAIRLLMILCCYGFLYLCALILVGDRDLVRLILLYAGFCLLIDFFPQIKFAWQRRGKDAQWLLDTGDAHYDAGRYEESLTAHEQALQVDPRNAILYCCKGSILYRLKRYEEALAAYEQAIRLNVQYADAYIGKGNVLAEYKQYEDALAAYEQAIQIDSGLAAAYNNKAQTLYRMRRDEEALAVVEQALHLNPELPEAYQNKGWILERLEGVEEARQAYDKAKELGYYEWKGQILRSIVKIKKYIALVIK